MDIWNPPGLHPPLRLYSHLAVGPTGGRPVFVAGQVGLDESGALVGEDDVERQTEQTFHNLGVALQAAGAGWADVARLGSYVVGEHRIEGFTRARERVFAELFPDRAYPTSTLIVVAALARPQYLVEVDAFAVTR